MSVINDILNDPVQLFVLCIGSVISLTQFFKGFDGAKRFAPLISLVLSIVCGFVVGMGVLHVEAAICFVLSLFLWQIAGGTFSNVKGFVDLASGKKNIAEELGNILSKYNIDSTDSEKSAQQFPELKNDITSLIKN